MIHTQVTEMLNEMHKDYREFKFESLEQENRFIISTIKCIQEFTEYCDFELTEDDRFEIQQSLDFFAECGEENDFEIAQINGYYLV